MRCAILAMVMFGLAGCEGKQGPTGPRGERGEQGLQGERGAQGEVGATGTQGPQGPQGTPGGQGAASAFYVARFDSDETIDPWVKGNRSNWTVKDGRLLLSGFPDSLMQLSPDRWFENDLDLSVSTEWIEGTASTEYGILLRDSFVGGYGFGVTAAGTFSLIKYRRGVLPQTLVRSNSDAIVLNGKNDLRVVALGSVFEMYINGTRVAVFSDNDFGAGYVGLFVGGLQRVAFDDFKVAFAVTL